jgi:predicted transcriptional regulator
MAMTLRLTPDEAEGLRQVAEAEKLSMQDVARTAIREYVDRRAHKTRVSRVLDRVLAEEEGVLKRLGEI